MKKLLVGKCITKHESGLQKRKKEQEESNYGMLPGCSLVLSEPSSKLSRLQSIRFEIKAVIVQSPYIPL